MDMSERRMDLSEDDATLSGAHRSYRGESRLKDPEDDPESEELDHGGERRDVSEQEEKLYGVAIQFQKDPNNVLRVFDIKKGGPAWNKGILKGDIIHDVDDMTVYKLPFDQVSPLIKGRYNSIVVIGFLRPMVSEEQTEQEVRFQVKMRRLEPVHGPQHGQGVTTPGGHVPPSPVTTPGSREAGREGGGGGGREGMSEELSELPSHDLSVEARLRSRGGAAVFAATGGLVGGGHATVGRGHHSMPVMGAATASTREWDGRRVQSEQIGGWARKAWKSTAAVSAAERVEIANDQERLLRQRRMRSKALRQEQAAPAHHAPASTAPLLSLVGEAAPPPPSSIAPQARASQPPAEGRRPPPLHAPLASAPLAPAAAAAPPVLSSEQLQRMDHYRHVNRLLQSRKPRPQSAVKGYGEHKEWLVEVEARRKAARASLAGPVNLKGGAQGTGSAGAGAERKLPPPTSEHVGLYSECADLAEGCRACISVLPGVA